MFKARIKTVLALLLAFVLVFPIYASELTDAQEEKAELENQLEEVKNKIAELQNEADDLEAVIAEFDAQIAELQVIIDEYSVLVDKTQESIDEKQAEIEDLQAQIDEKQQSIDEEYARMKIRIQYMYENMGNGYIEALFSTESFGAFFEKLQYLNDLTEYDQEQMAKLQGMIDDINDDKSVLEDDQAQLEVAKADLEDVKQSYVSTQDDLEVAQAERQTALEELMATIGEQEDVEAALEAEIEAKQEEIEELVAAYNADAGSYMYTGGTFLWPLPSPYGTDHISSGYGYRSGAYSGFHAGIDIWCPSGTSIFAVLDGQVVSTYYSSSAGNYTILYHGNGLYTEYMHQSGFAVSAGDHVSQGQVIGYVGSTGWSTGSHLHIGVMIGGVGSSYRVDPGGYLGIY